MKDFDSKMKAREPLIVLLLCAAASLAAVAWSWRAGAMLNYGDAVAHLHIARRVLDARLPRLSEFGSVWLPLPHLLMLPFVQVHAWWANGAAALPASVFSYLAACVGLYRLARQWMRVAPAALALAFFALNPNLLYLQTTAMTEPLFLCEMIWAALWMVEWRRNLDHDAARARRLEAWIAFVLIAAVFTRYDGWILAALAWTGIGITLLRRRELANARFWLLSMCVLAAPLAWFVYNQMCFGDWLEFMRGPYSAKAIELRTAAHGAGPPHPGWHNPWVSLLFFMKAAEMDAITQRFGNGLLFFSALGTLCACAFKRSQACLWALLLWLPLPFYAYSVSYGSVPIFLPPWWPHSWYNTRYGMEMLPALALGAGFFFAALLLLAEDFKPKWRNHAATLLAVLIVLNAAWMLHRRPLTYVEGIKNIEARRPLEERIPPVLRAEMAKRPGAAILMDTSVYPNLVAFSGLDFRQTINESDLYIFENALQAPAQNAALVLAFEGDAIDRAVRAHPQGLSALAHFSAPGQPSATLYCSSRDR